MKWKTLENCCSKWRVEIWDLERKTLEGRMNLITHFPSNVKKIRGRYLPDLYISLLDQVT